MKTLVVWQKGTRITYKHYSELLLSYEQTDKMGYGHTILIGFSLPLRKRLSKAVSDLIAGLHYKYPICCILNFCLDTILNRPSAQLRYNNTKYVECCLHINKHGRKAIPLDLY